VSYDELSEITITVGEAVSSGTAYYGLDFSTGSTFTNVVNYDLILTGSTLTTSETGTTASFTLKLTTAPTANVTVSFTGLDSTENSLSPSTLTFTTSNWNTAQTVTVTGVDDALVDGDIAYTLTASASSTDTNFNGRTALIDITNTDNDVAATAGLTLTGSPLTTSEAGTTATFTAVLTSAPSSDVTVTLTGLDNTEGSLSASSLTFTSANWNTAQTVTVTGLDDNSVDGSIAYTLTATTSSSDSLYSGANAKTGTVTVTNSDNDTAGLTLTGSPLTTSEAGTTASFTAVLTSAPSSDVTVTLTGLDNTEDSLSASTLTFTSANWNTAQTVTVTGLDDNSVDGSIAYTLTATTSSSDSSYSGANAKTGTVTVTNSDNDTAGLTLSASTLTTTEAGTDASFTVKLSSQPSATVTVTVTSPDSTEGTVNPTTLTFTTANWATAQTVTVTHVDDSADDGDITYAVGLASTSTDTNYQGKTGSVAVTNTDNELPPSLSIADVVVAENAGTANFTVMRSGATGGTTTVAYATSSGTAISGTDFTAASGTLSFAPGETSKTINIAIIADVFAEKNETFTVNLATISDTSSNAEIIADNSAVGIITDNNVAMLLLSKTVLHTTEGGIDDSFTVVLSSQPSASVTTNIALNLNSGDITEGVETPTVLIFTSETWNIPQTVTIRHVDDTLDDGDISYNLNMEASSADQNYQGQAANISITNDDNDAPPSLSINNVTIAEDAGTASFQVTRSGATGDTTTVNYTTNANTASSGTDFSAASGTLQFAPGETTKTISIVLDDDAQLENTETFTVKLSAINDSTSSAEAITVNTGTATILDNDTAELSLNTAAVTTSETGTNANFTVKLSSKPSAAVTLTVSSADTSEGTVKSTTLTFTPNNWATEQTVSVTHVDDSVDDGDSHYLVNLVATSADANFQDKTTSVSVTNLDDDAAPSLSIADLTFTEQAGIANFIVTRNGANGGITTVNFTTSSGTATADSDFVNTQGTLTFAPGEITKNISIISHDDNYAEADENFTVRLSAITDSVSLTPSIADNSAIGTIIDNNLASIILSKTTLHTSEAGLDDSFTVVLSSQPTAHVTADVSLDLTSGDITEGVETPTVLIFTSETWNIPQTVTIRHVDDTLDDSDISYTLALTADSHDTNYQNQTATVSITNDDNDAPPSLSINNVTIAEDVGTASFQVTRSGANGEITTVDYSINSDTAVLARDFTANSGTLSFAPGETSKKITVVITDDNIAEAAETFRVVLANVVDPISDAEVITNAIGLATITDNDSVGLLASTTNVQTTEAGTNSTFTLSLSSQPTANVSVALDSSDHTEGTVSPTLLFTSSTWNIPQTVVVTHVDDLLYDGDSQYVINSISNSTDPAYQNKTSSVSALNLDNDQPPTISINELTVKENAALASLTVTRTGAIDSTTSVNYTTTNNLALAADDFSSAQGTLTFLPDEVTKTITIALNDDSLAEGNEDLFVDLSAIQDTDSLTASILNQRGIINILDNDSPDIVLNSTELNITEAGVAANFNVQLNSQPRANVSIRLVNKDNTEGVISPTTLIFTPTNWATAQTVKVSPVDDNLADGDITYTIALSSRSADAEYTAQTDTIKVTTHDNDLAPSLSIDSISVAEDAKTARFTVTRIGATGDISTANFTTTHGSAQSDSDFTTSTGSVRFAPGVTQQVISVPIHEDNVKETTEFFSVLLSDVKDGTSTAATFTEDTGTATIIDNDTANLVFSTDTLNTSEAGIDDQLTVQLSSQPKADVTLSISSNDTSEGTETPSTLMFTATNWNVPQTISIRHLDDHLDDGDIAYTIDVSADSHDQDYADKTAQLTAINADNDMPPSLSIADISVDENAGVAHFQVSRSGATEDVTTVNYVTHNGNALASSDFTNSQGSVRFAVGETSKIITINISNDNYVETDESFSVELLSISDDTSVDETISKAFGVASLIDDDVAGLVFNNTELSTSEAGKNTRFTVKLSSQPTTDVTVNIASNDTTEGIVNVSTLRFTADNWASPQTVGVTHVDDKIDDGDSTYALNVSTVSSDTHYQNISNNLLVTNTDNDAAPALSLSHIKVQENNGLATFTVIRTGATGATTSVKYATSNQSAQADTDFTSQTGVLDFAPGVTKQTISIPITDDEITEHAEQFIITLSAITDFASAAANISSTTAIATIKDNDHAGLSLSKQSLITSEAGSNDSFTVQLTSQPTAEVMVAFSQGNKREGIETPTALLFNETNWNTPQSVTVRHVDDHLDDGDITYKIDLTTTSVDTNYQGNKETITVSNIDNDAAPSITIDSITVAEEAGTAILSLLRTGAADDITTVDYVIHNGTAEAGSDFDNTTGSVRFAAGENYKTLIVKINNDPQVESNETFSVELRNINDNTSAEAIIATALGSVTITDNDHAGLILSDSKLVTTEAGADSEVSIALSSQPTDRVTLTIRSTDETEGHVDSTTLNFTRNNWNTPQTLTVHHVDDKLDDGDISYHINVSSTSLDSDYQSLQHTVAVINKDDDVQQVQEIIPIEQTVIEGDKIAFTVKLSAPKLSPTRYSFSLTGDMQPQDFDRLVFSDGVAYNQSSNKLLVPAGIARFTVTLPTTDDAFIEATEHFSLRIGDAISSGIIIDNDVKDKQLSIDLPAKYDSGEADDDNISNISLIALQGQSTPNLMVNLYLPNGQCYASVRADAKGNWVIKNIELTSIDNDDIDGIVNEDGFYTFTVTSVDTAGIESLPASLSLLLDRTPPSTPLNLELTDASDIRNDNNPDNHLTNISTPVFTVLLPTGQDVDCQPGYLLKLYAQPVNDLANKLLVSSALLTQQQVSTGTVDLTTLSLDDNNYLFSVALFDQAGNVKNNAVRVTEIRTDLDGIAPFIEAVSPNNGDFNKDGIVDSAQNNVTSLPLASYEDFSQGNAAPQSSFGSIISGEPTPTESDGAINLIDSGQLSNVVVLAANAPILADAPLPTNADVINRIGFTVSGQTNMSLPDSDNNPQNGLQTRITIELPSNGLAITSYYKVIPATATTPAQTFKFMADGNPLTYDDGAEFIDFTHDGRIDRIVVTLTDNALGDTNPALGVIDDPALLVYERNTLQAHTDIKLSPLIDDVSLAEVLISQPINLDCLPAWLKTPALQQLPTTVPSVANLSATGNGRDNQITGNSGANALAGLQGNDTLIGGAGADQLTGGKGADTFRFLTATDSPIGERLHDVIIDFSTEDTLDFSALHAFIPQEVSTFSWVSQFSGHAGELLFNSDRNLLAIDFNGDSQADFELAITLLSAFDQYTSVNYIL